MSVALERPRGAPGWLYRRIFPRWRPSAELRPTTSSASGAAVRIRWLGTAGHVIETPTTTLLVDPYLTRPTLTELAGPIAPDETAIRARLPVRVDAVLCGHSHFDHLLDAPFIARTTGAKLAGSGTTCTFARASGVAEEQLVLVPPSGRTFTVGDATIRFIPSLHGRIFLGRVPFPGEVAAPPPLPARFWHYRMGGAFGLLIDIGGVRIYHNGSADLIDAALDGARADVLLVGLAGRKGTRDYLRRLYGALAPKLIVPTHHDAFFAPLDGGLHLLPGIDLEGFAAETRAHAPSATLVTPAYDEALAVPVDARAAAFVA
ncbi:MAG TPA: MBL fold metallo-hydrolase [Polyangia bacterium]|nr:MBL fold metallo-hydrolase [Polyangia bacterium]